MSSPRVDPGLSLVLIATVGLSAKSVLAKLAFATGMTVDGVLALRMAIALPVFWLGALALRRRAMAGLEPREALPAVAAGGLLLVSMICDLKAIDHIGAGLSRVILFTFPLVIVVIDSLRARTLPTPARLAAFALSYAGLAVMILGPGHLAFTPGFVDGVLWSFGAAFAYSAYLLAGQHLGRRIGSVPFTGLSNLGVVIGGIALFPLWYDAGDLFSPSSGVLWTALMAVFATALPYFLLFEGVRRLGAQRAAVVSLAGPVLTVLAAWLVLGEALAPIQVAGFALVLLGIAVLEGLVRWPVAKKVGIGGEQRTSGA